MKKYFRTIVEDKHRLGGVKPYRNRIVKEGNNAPGEVREELEEILYKYGFVEDIREYQKKI